MDQTTNYGLNQWGASDRVQREDFNSDNRKLDAALASIAAAAGGGAKLAVGSYIGTGAYEEANPCSLTFAFEPKLVFVQNSGAQVDMQFWAVRGTTKGVSTNSMSAQMSPLFFTWSGNMLSWYARNAAAQLNASGTTYYYCAIG